MKLPRTSKPSKKLPSTYKPKGKYDWSAINSNEDQEEN